MENTIKMKAWLTAVAATLAMPVNAQSDAEFETQVERMTDMVMEMSPVAVAMDKAMALDPKWPFQDRVHLVSADELTCMRDELSAAQLRKSKAEEVRSYARADSQRFAADFHLLSSGISTALGKSVVMGVEAARNGQRLEPSEALKDLTGNQYLAMTLFVSDPKHQALRELTGYDQIYKAERGSTQSQAAQTAGANMMAKYMFTAMDACSIKPARLLAKPNTAAAQNALQFEALCNRPAPQPLPATGKIVPPRPDPRNTNAFPEYPLSSKRMGEEGAALVNMYVTEDGKVARAQLANSSGSPRLDQAALEGTREWRYLPGRVDGEPACMWVTTSINFKLRTEAAPETPGSTSP